jgi:hypothetical protein
MTDSNKSADDGRGYVSVPVEAGQVDDMAMLIHMLVRHVPETKQIRQKALDYLARHDLMGSPFRAAAPAVAPALDGEVREKVVPHCQLCGGKVQGWICQTCEADFEEIGGLLILKSDNARTALETQLLDLQDTIRSMQVRLDRWEPSMKVSSASSSILAALRPGGA